MFFVLSGFLITHLLLREERADMRLDLPRFYARRALRILPPLLVYLAAVLVATWTGLTDVPANDFLACLVFVRNYIGSSPATAHFWSLAIEEQFYLIWPVLLAVVGGPRVRAVAAVALVLAAPLWMNVSFRLAGGADQLNDKRTDLRLGPILMGSALALVLGTGFGRRACLAAAGTGFAIGAVAVLVAVVFFGALSAPGIRFVGPVVAAGSVAVLINHTIHRPESLITRALEFGPVVWIGRLSYSLYLWQQPFSPNVFAESDPSTWFRQFPVNLILALGCAVSSFYLVERPLLALRRRFRPVAQNPKPEAPA
jgi:peptidoglycan/LPS O-acetylase OafA/YrhL